MDMSTDHKTTDTTGNRNLERNQLGEHVDRDLTDIGVTTPDIQDREQFRKGVQKWEVAAEMKPNKRILKRTEERPQEHERTNENVLHLQQEKLQDLTRSLKWGLLIRVD